MKVSGAGHIPTTQVDRPQRKTVDQTAYQAQVLKKALDGHQKAAEKLLNLLDPKGQNLDIKA